MRVQVLDFETSISSAEHGSMAKDPINDFCTIIWGDKPENVRCIHNYGGGFKRILGVAGLEILEADVIVGHNLPFDLAYIVDYFKADTPGIETAHIPQTWDTQIAEYLMSGQRHTMSSLAELQEKYLGQKIKKDRISKLYKKRIGADKIIAKKDKCPRLWALYQQYCVDDGVSTLQVFEKQFARAKKMGMLPVIKLHNRYMVALVMMMAEGINVDLVGVEKTIRDFKLKEIECLQEASAIVSKYWKEEHLPPFNIGSPTHKSAILFGGHIKCKVVRDNGTYKDGRTKTKIFDEAIYVKGMGLPTSLTSPSKVDGKYETGTGVVQSIMEFTKTNPEYKEIHRYCELQVEAMNYKKMVSTYLEAFRDKSIDGKLYPQFNNTAVVTGRLSSSAPNFQNIPARGEMNYHIQGKLIAPEGWVCVAIDYSQLELYIAAWNSGDEKLIDDLNDGLDFHCQSLSWAEKKSYDEIVHLCKVAHDKAYELKRTKSKPITFEYVYGAHYKTTAQRTGLPEEVVKSIHENLDTKYWKLKLFNEHVYHTACQNQLPSLARNIPTREKNYTKEGRRFNEQGVELLPIEQGNNKYFDNDYIRHVGYYQTKYGKTYSFQEYARVSDRGEIRRGIRIPQTKNYTCQGGAADAMAAATVEVTEYALANSSEVKIVNTIHDSIWFYIREDALCDHLTKLEDIMCNMPKALKKHLGVDIGFAFKVESKTGSNFSEMNVWENKL